MSLYSNRLYMDDVKYVSNLDLPWEKLKNQSVLISGASGLLGSFFIDVLMNKNINDSLNCNIYALGRSESNAKKRFEESFNHCLFHFIACDIKKPLNSICQERIDYVLHLASNTHPMQYSTDPIGTITTNIIGLQNMLEFAVEKQAKRFAFASSNEIYGENRGDVDLFEEDYCGYINSNTLRAGYPESKRCGEALCQAYMCQKGLGIVIPRFTRSYGPTMKMTDTKALSQFLKKGINGEDIVLKSDGTQYYSYLYMADSISGLLTVLLCGENGNAYNIADQNSDIRLKDLARIIADTCGTEVVFEIPDEMEAAGYSKATKARLSGDKIKTIGWQPRYSIESGIKRTIKILKSVY